MWKISQSEIMTLGDGGKCIYIYIYWITPIEVVKVQWKIICPLADTIHTQINTFNHLLNPIKIYCTFESYILLLNSIQPFSIFLHSAPYK